MPRGFTSAVHALPWAAALLMGCNTIAGLTGLEIGAGGASSSNGSATGSGAGTTTTTGPGGGGTGGDAPGCIRDIAVRRSATCVVFDNGQASCVGQNDFGQLGNGMERFAEYAPVAVTGLSDVQQVVVGAIGAAARLGDGTVHAWGENVILGRSINGTHDPTPTAVPNLGNVRELASGSHHMCAVNTNDEVLCWGSNENEEVGEGLGDPVLGPERILDNVRHVSVGGRHTCVIRTDDTVWCWGQGSNDATGGSFGGPPNQIGNLTARAIASGGKHNCAVRLDGSVRCWGSNVHGQLGQDADTSSSAIALDVPGLTGVQGIVAGGRRTCAYRDDGSVWCWGETPFGSSQSPPIGIDPPAAVPDYQGSTLVALTGYYSCARVADGTMACRGENHKGQLGDGTTDDRLTFAPALFLCP